MKVSLDGTSKIVVSVVNNFMPAQSLKTLMENVWGSHAINGSFFCPAEAAYSRCVANTTDGLRKSNGELYSKRGKDVWEYKSVFGFDSEGTPMPLAEKNPRYRANNTWQNDAVDTIFNGMMLPTLVKDWVNVAVLFDELNNDPKQGKSGNKTFICSTQDKSIVYMWYVDGVTFSSVADYIIETFGCYNAGLLDNGWTKAMINNSKYVAGPWRAMMDAFVVIEGDNVWAQIAPINMPNEIPTTTTPPVTANNEELQNAITWMYNAGLTMYSTIADFLPDNNMTREEASKFFSVFAKNEFSKTEKSSTSCSFYDSKYNNPTLTSSITSACKMWLFKWYKGNFSPRNKLTNAEAITVLMRIMIGQLVEPSKTYYSNYLLKAQEFGLVSDINVDNNITRWEAAILLYKASIYRENLGS